MEFLRVVLLFIVLLNPFMLTVYLMDVLRPLQKRQRWSILLRASVISGVVFWLFGVGGDAVFSVVLQARFAAFLMFGGILFLVIAIRYVLSGARAMTELAGGSPQRVAGAIAMPFMIGPGTVSASVIAGVRLDPATLLGAVFASLLVTSVVCGAMFALFDHVEGKRGALVERYADVVGRISALIIGTIAVEMIFRALETWEES